MTKQLMIYENAVPLSSEAHRDISVKLGQNYSFAAGINSVPLLTAEFAAASPHFAIVFAGTDEAVMPVALLGLRADENLFVAADGSFKADYVPAFLRRYPFVFAQDPQDPDRLTLCIDESFEGVNRDGRGERLFDSEGNRTGFLAQTLQFSSDFQAQHQLTQEFGRKLQSLGLFEEASATATLPDGKVLALSGFKRINLDKLRALDDAQVIALFREDFMGLIYLHLASLSAMSQMLRLIETPASLEEPA